MTLKDQSEYVIQDILSTMQIPQERKQITQDNLQWMLRNLGIQNNTHPRFDHAMRHIKFLIAANGESENI